MEELDKISENVILLSSLIKKSREQQNLKLLLRTHGFSS